jgi:hypothetical protein
MGYTDNPQNYIVKIEKSAIQETWRYIQSDTTHPQTFNHQVAVQFIEISKSNITNQGYI